ncbi:MAG: glycoside hydrolase family 97 protein [Gammaproteobacteria bacterium]|nr:glycoside hydrolase family 97 protein [Gammaproteobacteria bacterium]MBU1556890.1 glycoside hydrolase family 97 protein [Gammaproteobacteria bacterium]MBU2069978.1 glycoside hydrolase family 97 protein [Gammaproteobacteria bacterium]MBU2185123.1 glycoside hydrolase family 97 protein [Gammaproteobacteria bacterium]MBU2206991.1 glycoside hydrolase family 97 protein [Gammaproteobacteria bacterium]
MRLFIKPCLLAALLTPFSLLAASLSVTSPDGNIELTLDDTALTYQVKFHKQQVIAPSALGFRFLQLPALTKGYKITGHSRNSVNQHWQQPWGERATVVDQHNELAVTLKHPQRQQPFTLRFKLFNDGLGFRYEVPSQGVAKLDIIDELTEFRIADSKQTTAWWIPGRGWNRYEMLYRTTALNEVDRAHTPFTFKLQSGVHLSIHEAALINFAGMVLDQQRDGVLKSDLTPWSDGIRVKTSGSFTTPWRTIQIASNAVGLLNSDLILNLNEPNKLGDVSWVKPGKYAGIWWGMHLETQSWGSGPKHGATTANTKAYIDFAAKNGFDGVLVEGWNTGWDGEWFLNGAVFNFTTPYPDFDLAAISAYGKAKGVKLIGHHETSGHISNYEAQMADAYDLYAKHGVSQIKTGYVADGGQATHIDESGIERKEWHDGQLLVNHYLHSVTEAAKRQISINTHEPIKDTGLRRTYPNWISREGARGQEYNAWGSPPNPPEHTAMLPFTRMLSGPMDFTPGIFNLAYKGLDAKNRVQTTLAKQLALYVVLYSPIQMVADLPEHYDAHPNAFQFIKDVPTDWAQSKALQGEVGDYVVFARQDKQSADWYLGALTDEQARTVTVKLDFLPAGKHFTAQIYRDGKDADWRTKPYQMIIEQRSVSATDSLTLPLASSGGAAIRFKAL